jgi:hypothetical protein
MNDQKRSMFRYRIVELLEFVALVAGTAAIFGAFWRQGLPNHYLLLGCFVVFVSVATVAAYTSKPGARGPLSGLAIFGWTYLVVVLHQGLDGFGTETLMDAQTLEHKVQIGFMLALLAGLASHIVTQLFGRG